MTEETYQDISNALSQISLFLFGAGCVYLYLEFYPL